MTSKETNIYTIKHSRTIKTNNFYLIAEAFENLQNVLEKKNCNQIELMTYSYSFIAMKHIVPNSNKGIHKDVNTTTISNMDHRVISK